MRPPERPHRFRCLPFDAAAHGADAAPAGARVLHFFRHGEALQQVRNAEAQARGAGCRCFDLQGEVPGYVCPYWSDDLVDAPLTDLGRLQTRGRGADLRAQIVLSSPMTRTLESSRLAFGEGTAVIAVPELRPRIGPHMHSKCSPRDVLAARFPRVDLSRIEDGDDRRWKPENEPREALEDRAARFLELAFERPETAIGVVTHFTVLLALLLSADETFTLGPSRRPPGTPALLDCSECPDPEALRVPVAVGESRSLLITRSPS